LDRISSLIVEKIEILEKTSGTTTNLSTKGKFMTTSNDQLAAAIKAAEDAVLFSSVRLKSE